ncbi:MAG: hypothetical protein ACFFHD_01005 [Promethearchaeota archaeon]
MVDFKKDTWIYILIAAILALISIFTPIASYETDTQYFFGGVLAYNADADPSWMGYGAATIWTLALTSMSIALLLFYGIHNMKGMEFKWDWLVYALCGIVMFIFPILMMVFDLEYTYGTIEYKLDVGFAPIGILISGIISIAVFALEKFVSGRGA